MAAWYYPRGALHRNGCSGRQPSLFPKPQACAGQSSDPKVCLSDAAARSLLMEVLREEWEEFMTLDELMAKLPKEWRGRRGDVKKALAKEGIFVDQSFVIHRPVLDLMAELEHLRAEQQKHLQEVEHLRAELHLARQHASAEADKCSPEGLSPILNGNWAHDIEEEESRQHQC